MTEAPQGRIDFSDLRRCPHFIDTVADRMWRAWWQPAGLALEEVVRHLHGFLTAETIPMGIVAHDGGLYVGSVLLIQSDLAERPDYAPWVAALWVDPEHREFGVGTALAERAVAHAFALGYPRVHLCARPDRIPFYAARGWTLIETDVGPHQLAVFLRDDPQI